LCRRGRSQRKRVESQKIKGKLVRRRPYISGGTLIKTGIISVRTGDCSGVHCA